MFLDCIDRHLAVCGAWELPALVRRDPRFWHSISIMEPVRPRAPTAGLRDVLSLRFDDAENLKADDMGIVFPRAEHIRDAFAFADERWGEPLLVQCWAGQSRSAALALGMIARGLYFDGEQNFANKAVDLLLQIRSQSRPNWLVLCLALETFLPKDEAEALAHEINAHPVLMKNRFSL